VLHGLLSYIHISLLELHTCSGNWAGLFFVSLHMYCRLRSSYQRGCCDPINRFNSATLYAYPSQARTWLSNGIYHGPLCVQWAQLRGEVIIRLSDIVEIDYHPCLNFFFRNYTKQLLSILITYIYCVTTRV